MAKKIEKTSEEFRAEARGLLAQAQTALEAYGQRSATWFGKPNSERANDTMIDNIPIADMHKKVEDAQTSNVVVRFFRRLFTSQKKQESLFYSIKIKTAFQALNTAELTTDILSTAQHSLEDIDKHLSWFSGVQKPLNLLKCAHSLFTQASQVDIENKKVAFDAKVNAVPVPDEVLKRNDAALNLEWDSFVRKLKPEDWRIYHHFKHWPADKFIFSKKTVEEDRNFSFFVSEPEENERYFQETLLPKYQATDTKKASAAKNAIQWFRQSLVNHLETYKQEHEFVYNKAQLFRAIKANDLARVKKIIDLSQDSDLLSSSPVNENPLFMACRHGHLEIAKYILTKDSTLLLDRTNNNENALTLALSSKNLDLVKHLVEDFHEEPHPQIFSADENESFVRVALQSTHIPTITYLLEKFPFLCGYLPKLIPEAKDIPQLKDHISHLYYLHGDYLMNHAQEQWWEGDEQFRKTGLRPAFEAALAQYNFAIKKDKNNDTPNINYITARMNLRIKLHGLSKSTGRNNVFKRIQSDYEALRKQNVTFDANTYVTLILAKIQQNHITSAQKLLDEAFTHHPNKGMLLYLEFYLAVKTDQQEKSKQWIFEKARGHQVLPLFKEFYPMISCFPWLVTEILQHDALDLPTKNEFTKLLNTYPNPYGKSLLHIACELEDVRLANTLLTAGVGYTDSKVFKHSPLEHAAQLGRDTMVAMICEKQRYTDAHMEKAIEQTLGEGTPQTLDILLEHAKVTHLPNEKLHTWITQAKATKQPEKEASLLNKVIGKLTALQEKYVSTKQLLNGRPHNTLFFAQDKKKRMAAKNPESSRGHRRALSMEL